MVWNDNSSRSLIWQSWLSTSGNLPSSHILFSKVSAWSPWWTRTCRARSSACQSSWSTAAGRPGAQSGGFLCSGRGWSGGSHHHLHSGRSYSGRKISQCKKSPTTRKVTLQWKFNPPKKTFSNKHHRGDYEHKNIQAQMKTILQTKISSLPHKHGKSGWHLATKREKMI